MVLRFVDELIDLTPENMERVLDEMFDGTRTEAHFKLTATPQMLEASRPVRGAFILLAEKLLRPTRVPA